MKDEEIFEKAREFADIHGDVPSGYAFEQGARWAREMFNQGDSPDSLKSGVLEDASCKDKP